MPDLLTVCLLVAASSLAGFVDAVAGGGGLILLPALLIGLPPTTAIPTVLGTNKLAACSGTTVAAWQFVRGRVVPWRDLPLPVGAAILGSAGGAHFAYQLNAQVMRPVMLVLLLAVLLFVLFQPRLGAVHAPTRSFGTERVLIGVVALSLGFYDGFFGPGTGSFLIYLFVSLLGYDFVRASALAKAANWGSNASALVIFAAAGSWMPLLGVLLAIGNVVGARFGARLAIAKGSRFIRALYVVVVGALVLRLGWQVWRE